MLDGMVFDEADTRGAEGGDDLLDALLARASAGDARAVLEMYDVLGDRVYGLMRRMTGDAHRSAELLLDVFELVAETAIAAPSGISPTAWVMSVAHDVAVADAQQLRAAGGARPAVEEDPDDVDVRVESRRVARALQSLPDVERDALTFAYYGGYTRAEIAALTGRTAPQVYDALRDGLTRLRIETGAGA